MRTDMKAKVFEWVDDSLDVPTGLLADELGQGDVRRAIEYAETWNRRLNAIHSTVYGSDQLETPRQRMRATYWILLAEPFRRFVWASTEPDERQEALRAWREQLFEVGKQVLNEAVDAAGERGEALGQRAEALTRYRIARASQAKEWSE
jgi:hypothetical protein